MRHWGHELDAWGSVVAYRWASMNSRLSIVNEAGEIETDCKLLELAENWRQTEQSQDWPSRIENGHGRGDKRSLRSIQIAYIDACELLRGQSAEANMIAAYVIAGFHLRAEEKTSWTKSENGAEYYPVTEFVNAPTIHDYVRDRWPRLNRRLAHKAYLRADNILRQIVR